MMKLRKIAVHYNLPLWTEHKYVTQLWDFKYKAESHTEIKIKLRMPGFSSRRVFLLFSYVAFFVNKRISVLRPHHVISS